MTLDPALYETILDNLHDGVYYVDRERRILFWNTFSSVDMTPRLKQADPSALSRPFRAALRAGGRLP